MTEFSDTAHSQPPPRDEPWDYDGLGFDSDHGAPPPPPRRGMDLSFLFVILDGLRRSLPGELQAQFTTLVREMLLTLRSLIDWYLERLDKPRRGPRVEDIPID